jgi:hypothetical protein
MLVIPGLVEQDNGHNPLIIKASDLGIGYVIWKLFLLSCSQTQPQTPDEIQTGFPILLIVHFKAVCPNS